MHVLRILLCFFTATQHHLLILLVSISEDN
jgi:hypothetical protein